MWKEPIQQLFGNTVSWKTWFFAWVFNAISDTDLGDDLNNDSNSIAIPEENNERYKLSKVDGVENAKLTITKTTLADRGFFTCYGFNEFMTKRASSSGFLRVKDKLAALWPFLGICAEVFVLCAIILIYENRRNKDSENDSDTDQGDQ